MPLTPQLDVEIKAVTLEDLPVIVRLSVSSPLIPRSLAKPLRFPSYVVGTR